MQDRRTLTFDGKFFWCKWNGETTTTHPRTGDIVVCLLSDFSDMMALLNFWTITRRPATMAGVDTGAVFETLAGFTPYNSAMYVITGDC